MPYRDILNFFCHSPACDVRREANCYRKCYTTLDTSVLVTTHCASCSLYLLLTCMLVRIIVARFSCAWNSHILVLKKKNIVCPETSIKNVLVVPPYLLMFYDASKASPKWPVSSDANSINVNIIRCISDRSIKKNAWLAYQAGR